MKKLTFISAFVFLLLGQAVVAQASCGSITGPEDLGYGQPVVTVPISDCSDPFGVTLDPANPYSLKVNGEVVLEGGSAVIPESGETDIEVIGEPHQSGYNSFLFKHEGDDYEYIEQELPFPTYEDELQYIDFYFATEEERSLYAEILRVYYEGDLDPYFYDPETGEDIIDSTTGGSVEIRFWDYYNSFYDYYFNQPMPPLEPGTYTMVMKEYLFVLVDNGSWFNRLRSFFIPTAYAQCMGCVPPNIYTITFTLVAEEDEAGAPAVLFLPGIMGSRLYEDGVVCGNSGEAQLWFSVSDCKQLRLLTNVVGDSINEVYTKPEESSVIDEIIIPNLYKSFLSDLAKWKADGAIGDYRAVPYDWRLRLEDILKTKTVGGKVIYDLNADYTESYLYQSLAELATTTNSEVTIVAHSNGGLLTKVFLEYLESNNDPLLARIKNIIFIGVPQSGTPEALVGLLHGSGLGPFDLVVSQEMSRRLMNTGPFAYHLLPSGDHLEDANKPIITFEPGLATNHLIEKYGMEISSKADLDDFLLDTTRVKPVASDLAKPEVGSQWLVDYANAVHAVQSSWVAPKDIQVHQIAGVGLYTPVRIEYFTHERCERRNPLKLFLCEERKPVLGYRVIETRDGDRTVVADSALDMVTGGRYYLNLGSYDSVFRFGRVHRDMLEVPDVRDFVSDTLTGTTVNYEFLTSSAPNIDDSERYVTHLHSPLDLTLVLVDGTVVSSSTPLYQGVQYARYGELQTISGPLDMFVDAELKLIGESEGSFTLELEHWQGENMLQSTQFKAIPSSINTSATVILSDDIMETELLIDYEGDKTVDVIFKLSEEGELEHEEVPLLDTESPDVTPEVATPARSGGSVFAKKSQGLVAGVSVSDEEINKQEQLHALLLELYRLLNLLKLDLIFWVIL